MPYTIAERGGEYCVFKADAAGEPTGDTLGCHATQDEAAAQIGAIEASEKRFSQDTMVAFGGSVKALGDGWIEGPLVRFTSDADLDLEGEYFDNATDLGDATSSPVYYDHGLDPVLGLRMLGITGKAELRTDDFATWARMQLKLRDEYEAFLYEMAEKGKLGLSSGTAGHLIIREPRGKGTYIRRWPLGLDASLTLTPADPFTTVMPLKSLPVRPLAPLAPQADPSAGARPKSRPARQSDKKRMEATMSKKQIEEEMADIEEAPAEGGELEARVGAVEERLGTVETKIDALAAKIEPAIEEAVEVAVEAVEKRVRAGTFQPRAKNPAPYQSMGEVVKAMRTGDSRLSNLRSEYGVDLGAALGPLVGTWPTGRKATPSGIGESYPPSAGVLVGTQEDLSIMERIYDVGKLLQLVQWDTIGSGYNSASRIFEDETSRATGSRRGGIRGYWAAENSAVTASQPKFRKVTQILDKVEALVYVTDEQMEDTPQLSAYLSRNVPEELAWIAEEALINGTGSGSPLGILNSPAAQSVAAESAQAADTLVAENISNMWSQRWLGADDYVWLFNQELEPQFDYLAASVGTGGQLVWLGPGGLHDAPAMTIKGRPAYAVEYASGAGDAGDIILASFSQFWGIQKGGVKEQSSIHVRFLEGETVLKFTWRLNFMPTWSSALTTYKGTNVTTVSPFLYLAAR